MASKFKSDCERIHPDGSRTQIRWRRELGSDLSKACIIKEVAPDGSTICVWQHVSSADGYIIHLDMKYHR